MSAVATILAWAGGLFLAIDALAKANDLGFTATVFARITGLSRVAGPVVVALGLAEAGLGGAVLAGWAPARPAAAAFLLAVAGASLLLTRRSGVDDCGCHGRAVRMTPVQSAALAAAVAAALVLSFVLEPAGAPWRAAAVAAIAVLTIFGALALHGWKRGPLLDFTRLRRGARFDVTELTAGEGSGTLPAWTRGDVIVLATLAGCRACHAWARVLAAASRLPDVPPVVVLIAGTAADRPIEASPTTHVVAMDASDMARLARRTPMAAVVKGGVIVEIWDRVVPETIVSRLREARRDVRNDSPQAAEIRPPAP